MPNDRLVFTEIESSGEKMRPDIKQLTQKVINLKRIPTKKKAKTK